jgi:SAM-dependent methyltransferase
MDLAYWDRMAASFDEEIFDSLAEDVRGTIRGAIEAAAAPNRVVLDLGCGVGRYLPLLSGLFHEVHGSDWSAQCVAQAQRVVAGLPNVTVATTFAYRAKRWRGHFDLVTAINVVLDPDADRRRALLRQARDFLKPGGTFIVVVPSLEAVVFADHVRRLYAPRKRALYRFAIPAARQDPGILHIEGVPYKHWVGEELQLTLANAGFEASAPQRVEYQWKTEAASPPPSKQFAAPWDWLVVAQLPAR